MPLGIEPNGVMAALIERGGEFLSKELQQTGQVIETALVRNQAYKQAAQLGQELSQLDPASDNFPQQAAAITSQFPMAVQSGLAKSIVEPMAKAYAAHQAYLRTDMAVRGRETVAGLRGGGGGPVYVPPGGSPSPQLPDANADPLNVSMGQRGIPGVLSDTFHTMAGGEAPIAPADQATDTLPPLPNAATAMSRRKKPLQDYVAEASTIYNDALTAKKVPPFTRAQIATIAARQKAADDRQIDAETKAAAPPVDLHPSTVVPGILLTPKGTPFVSTESGGIAHPGSQFAQERIDMTKAAADARAARQEKTDVVKSVEAEYKDAAKDFATQDRLLHDLERDAKKITDPDALTAHQAVTREQQQRAQVAKDRQAKALKAYQDSLKGTSRDIITAPNGKRYEVDHATKKVLREIE